MKKKVTSAAAILSLGSGDRCLHLGLPPHRRAAAAALAVADARAALHALRARESASTASPQTFDGWAYPAFRQMRAAVKDQAELIAISYAERMDLTYGSDQEMEKAYLQYVSGWMFDCVRPAARASAACSPKTTT